MSRRQRRGIQQPLPWLTALAYPALWVFGWIFEKVHAPIVHDVSEEFYDPRATFKLWDKDFNLLATWKVGDKLLFTVDGDEGRYGGLVNSLELELNPLIEPRRGYADEV